MHAELTRRKFIWKLINGLFLFLFFSREKATAESNDIIVAQTRTDCFLVVSPGHGIYHPRDFQEGSTICGSERGLRFLQQNFQMHYNISFRQIPLPELTMAMRTGVCRAGVLLGDGSYTAGDLEQRLFGPSGFRVIQVQP
jgi:hypothetical protein